jgi:UDP-4-amino-4,6-dideoxy-N-acetyl-beta-L-altrosamine N-acetyltransferase
MEIKDFTKLSDIEKDTVLAWRNSDRVRFNMHNSNILEKENHLKFLESLRKSTDKKYFLVEDLGVIDFINIDGEFAEVGLYSNPAKFGVGQILVETILSFPYKHLYLEVIEDNYKAIELYKKFGFLEIERKTKNKRNIICMELKRDAK